MSKIHGTVPGDCMPLEVMARREDFSEGVSLYMRKRIVGVSVAFAEPVTFFERRDEGFLVQPFVRLPIQAAQQFMDELWQCGLRPSEGTGSAGALAATQRHLEDMRTLVFSEIKA